MNSQTRAVLAFLLLGAVLVPMAVLVSHLFPKAEGVDALPVAVPPGLTVPSSATPANAEAPSPGEETAPHLLQRPSLSRTQIAFAFAGEIWTVPREGGDARRLVTGQLRNYRPIFSPDGSQIAYTGILDGNADVYVVPSGGGEPKRLTYHPSGDWAVGWTPDGASIVFNSMRATPRDLPKLFT